MLNAIEPDSYIRPHRHLDPGKMEIFLALKGKGAVYLFDDNGKVDDIFLIEEGGETVAVEIPPGLWHTILSLKKGSVFFEIKDGPYVPATDKDFAPWAPQAGDPNCQEYLNRLARML